MPSLYCFLQQPLQRRHLALHYQRTSQRIRRDTCSNGVKIQKARMLFGETTICMSHIRNKTEVAPDMLAVFSRLVQKEKS